MDRIDYLRRNTNNFLKTVDVSKSQMEAADVCEFVRESVEPIIRSLPPDIGLDLELADGLPRARIDRERMRSVIDSVISNSVSAMPEGGRIVLKTSLAKGIISPAVRDLDPGHGARDFILIEIQDTEEGMTPAVSEHIFEAGLTTSQTGSGLGMAIVKKTMDDHGGHVMVASEPGAGTVVCLYMPVAGELDAND